MDHTEKKQFLPTRRSIMAGLAAMTLADMPLSPLLRAAVTSSSSLAVNVQQRGPVVPQNFTGLSYEAAQLTNPDFFSAGNHSFIKVIRTLGRRGVLRIGGGTSDYTRWVGKEAPGAVSTGAFGPDTSHGPKVERPITEHAIRNLRTFLDATGWDLLYGLNMARGTAEDAATEAAHVQEIIGPRMLAFQLGNEPDAWRTRYRPATWTYDDFFTQWKEFHKAVLKRVPNARFAGPDISNKIPWLTQFAQQAKDEIVLLTGHYYAEGPASSPKATMERLLDPNPKLVRDLREIMAAAHAANLPYRMCEGNSCWDGGKPGVSDTFGSALWCADMMLQFAQAGCAGVNLHGGGNGYYTPIAGDRHDGFVRRPEYFGMLLAERFAGAQFVGCQLSNASDRVTAYAAEKDGRLLLAIFNKTDAPFSAELTLTGSFVHERKPEVWRLTAPSVHSKTDVSFAKSNDRRLKVPGQRVTFTMAPYTGVLYSF